MKDFNYFHKKFVVIIIFTTLVVLAPFNDSLYQSDATPTSDSQMLANLSTEKLAPITIAISIPTQPELNKHIHQISSTTDFLKTISINSGIDHSSTYMSRYDTIESNEQQQIFDEKTAPTSITNVGHQSFSVEPLLSSQSTTIQTDFGLYERKKRETTQSETIEQDLSDRNVTSKEKPNEADRYHFWQSEQLTFSWIILITIVVGNSSILYKLKFSKRRKSNINYFIIHLAFADLLVGLISVAIDIVWRTYVEFKYGEIACKTIKFLEIVVLYSSTYLLVALSLDRWRAVARPLNFARKRRHGRYLVGGAWLFSALFTILLTCFWKIKTIQGKPQCWISLNKDGWKLYTVFFSVTVFVLPALIITVCYVWIVYTIWEKGRTNSKSEKNLMTSQINHNQSTSSASRKANDIGPGSFQTITPQTADRYSDPPLQHVSQAARINLTNSDCNICDLERKAGSETISNQLEPRARPSWFGVDLLIQCRSDNLKTKISNDRGVYQLESIDESNADCDTGNPTTIIRSINGGSSNLPASMKVLNRANIGTGENIRGDDHDYFAIKPMDARKNQLSGNKLTIKSPFAPITATTDDSLSDNRKVRQQQQQPNRQSIILSNKKNVSCGSSSSSISNQDIGEFRRNTVRTAHQPDQVLKQFSMLINNKDNSQEDVVQSLYQEQQLDHNYNNSCKQQEYTTIGRQHGSGVIPKARIKTIKMTLVIIIAFIVCWLPFITCCLLQGFGYIGKNNERVNALITFIQSSAFLNSAANPIIFWIFSGDRTTNVSKCHIRTLLSYCFDNLLAVIKCRNVLFRSGSESEKTKPTTATITTIAHPIITC